MDAILQMILEIVREQQRDAASLDETMTKAEVVDLTMSMMEQQGIEEYHEDLEADIYNRIQYLAPRLFEHEDIANEKNDETAQTKYSYRARPSQELLDSNENLALDMMIGDTLHGLETPATVDTLTLDYEQTYENIKTEDNEENSTSNIAASNDTPEIPSEASNIEETANHFDTQLQDEDTQIHIDEEVLNQLVLAKYKELASYEHSDLDIDSEGLASLVMQALQSSSESMQNTSQEEDSSLDEDSEQIDALLQEIWSSKSPLSSDLETQPSPQPDKTSQPEQLAMEEEVSAETSIEETLSHAASTKSSVFSKSSLPSRKEKEEIQTANDILSGLYDTKSYINAFTDYLETMQEQKKVNTGLASLDRILERGLHFGLYLLSSHSIDLPSLRLQIADQLASSGFSVCYLLFSHSRYECMAKSLARLTYELRGRDKKNAVCLEELYRKQEKTEISSLKTELSHYEKNIAPNLYFAEGKFSDVSSLISDIQTLLNFLRHRSDRKPIFILDNFHQTQENSTLLANLAQFCSDQEIILLASSSEEESCKLKYASSIQFSLADLPTQDSFTKQEMILESGESLTIDVILNDVFYKDSRKCQILSVPKFYFFASR